MNIARKNILDPTLADVSKCLRKMKVGESLQFYSNKRGASVQHLRAKATYIGRVDGTNYSVCYRQDLNYLTITRTK